jgi:DNA modification methylase
VSSPPYWGLRDYGHGDQIGLEQTPDEYVAQLVAVFREVRRVLRDDGTLWLNLGDSYAGSWGNQGRKSERGTQRAINGAMMQAGVTHATDCDMGADCSCGVRYPSQTSNTGKIPEGSGLKPKDLVGIPWRVAFALQADGWWLRSDIIWAKPNPMPESVTDRPTKAHEYVFLLTKSARYWYDADAVREPHTFGSNSAKGDAAGRTKHGRGAAPPRGGAGTLGASSGMKGNCYPSAGRNARTVWTIATQPYPGAHFAVMPPALAERCIKAGCPEGGTVLDPFGGAGTTGLVADKLGRSAILCELNPEFSEQAEGRIVGDCPLFAEVTQ